MPTFENGTPLGIVRSLLNETGLRKNAFGATRAPTVTDDLDAGYEPGSQWQFGGQVWSAVDVTAGGAVWVDLTEVGTGGGEPQAPEAGAIYQTRTVAQNTIVPNAITRIIVGGLAYREDTNGQALTTLDGRNWSPDGVVTPLHFGATGDGVADDRAAVQAAINHLVKSSSAKPDAFANSPAAVLDGAGRQYAIAGPVYVGNIGNGAGMLYHATLQNLKLVAIAGDWTGPIVVGVPKQMLVVCWRMAEAYTDNGAGIFNNLFHRITLDCNYLTGGIYLENTNSCTLRDSRIGRMGKDRTGYQTAPSRQFTGHPTGVYIGNGALSVDNLNIGGLEEERDEAFPSGEDQTTMGTVGMSHQSNDARINNVIISRVSKAAVFDNCGAVQVSNFHPWSRDVEIGENSNNLQFVNAYFDYTNVRLIGSFNHMFVGCAWPLGSNGAGHGLEIVATAGNSTAEGLVVSGCKFRSDIGIRWTTQGGGSWVPLRERKAIITGCSFETNPPEWQHLFTGSVSLAGTTWVGPVIETVNSLTGSELTPDNGTIQTATLTAALTLTEGPWVDGQTVVVTYTGADTHVITHPVAWLASDGFPSTLKPVQEVVYTKVGGVVRYGAGRGWAS